MDVTRKEAGMNRGAGGRKVAVWASAALLCAGVTIVMAASPAAAKKKHSANPLKGSYSGPTEEGTTVSFRVTKQGQVVDFTAPTTLYCTQPWTDMTQPPPPTITTTGAVTSAVPMRMTEPEPGFPRGHRWSYAGPGGNPPGSVVIVGKLAVGFRGLEGFYKMYRVPFGSLSCRDDVGPARLVSWDARKIR